MLYEEFSPKCFMKSKKNYKYDTKYVKFYKYKIKLIEKSPKFSILLKNVNKCMMIDFDQIKLSFSFY